MLGIANKKKRIAIGIFDYFGKLIFSPFKYFNKNKDLNGIKEILIVRVDGIGDVLLTLPAISALRKSFPKAYITLIVNEQAKTIIEDNVKVDKVLTLNAPWFYGFRKSSILEYLKLIKYLRGKNFDLVIDFKGDSRNIIFLLFLLKARIKVGSGLTGFGYLLDKNVHYDTNMHEIDNINTVLKSLEIKHVKKSFFKKTNKKIKIKVNKLFKRYNIKNKDFVVGLNLSPGYPSKQWDIKNFIELSKKLVEVYNAKIILTGSKNDISLSKELMKNNQEGIINLVGKTSIRELIELIKRCDLFLGSDSGPMHISGLVGTPTITLFGPTDPKRWKPLGDKNIIIHKNMPCSPCGEHFNCSKQKECMTKIKVKEVIDIINHKKLLIKNINI